MAQDDPIIPSAIIIPESLQPAPTPTSPSTLKRRQSSIAEKDTKRPRLNHNNDDTNSPQDDTRKAVRRQTGQLEERKRGQRLFGNLLGTLSQSSSSSAQKRRADIERRQQVKLKQQEEEVSQRRHDRLEELTASRRREQKVFDEKAMHLRHSNMLNQARFLQTMSEPKLYYKPWDLLPDQEDQIQRQITAAQATIDEELESFQHRREVEEEAAQTKAAAVEAIVESTKENTTMGDVNLVGSEPPKEVAESHPPKENDDTNVATLPTNGHAEYMEEDSSPATEKGDATAVEAAEAEDEHHGETVVEAAEDTIIY
ncbi:hypothetical protein EJ08DRAFT_619091 [Tothia fuscella]|uniref:Pinin/SDK/MemA protein domain-containing protein n=1 Tax=Tothia fuscella TaxID=1048955 RepID=A0A9P4NIP4_9PEZI|nr:hypothetical protein EJ08DRAFT_619091 [Tothia fuscella]